MIEGASSPATMPFKASWDIRTGKPFVSRLDTNKDGEVSRAEFDGPARHFRRLDRNNDGFLTEDEAPRGPPPGHRPRSPPRRP